MTALVLGWGGEALATTDPLQHPPQRVHDHIRVRAIVVHAGAMLLLPPAPAGGAWLPPGGGLEPGEGLAEGLAREVLEETGIRVRVGRPALLQEWLDVPGRAAGHEYDLHLFFHAQPVGDLTPRAEGVGQPLPEWVPLARVPDLPLYPAELKHLAAVMARGSAPLEAVVVRARLEPPTAPPRWVAAP